MKKICLLLLLFNISCFEGDQSIGAENTLRKFIDLRFQKVLSKEEMLSYVDGEMASEIKDMSKDEFSFFAKLKKYHKKDFKIRAKNCDNSKCMIVYTLKYDEYENKKREIKESSVEVKKVAEIVKNNDGKWKITKVDNVKTYLDSHQDIKVQQ